MITRHSANRLIYKTQLSGRIFSVCWAGFPLAFIVLGFHKHHIFIFFGSNVQVIGEGCEENGDDLIAQFTSYMLVIKQKLCLCDDTQKQYKIIRFTGRTYSYIDFCRDCTYGVYV